MKYLCFIFCVLLVGACSSTKGSGKETLFCELDKEVQDSLLSVSRKVLEEDYAPQAMIDFSGNCKFTERNIGPWSLVFKSKIPLIREVSRCRQTPQCHISCIITQFIIPKNTTCL